jgi:DNA-binding IclR family transcriptional regulator
MSSHPQGAPVARPGLSASRSIDIIEFLARFPERSFTLSALVRATGINVSSCHAVLNRLTERGYLARCPEQKTYSLGPSLIATGQAALKSQPLVARAQRAAQELVRDVGAPVLLSTTVAGEILAVLALEDAEGRAPVMWVGERLPLLPPLGAAFLAWASDEAVEAWIASRESPPDPRLAEEWRRNLELTRQRGFQISMRAANGPTIGSLMLEMAAGAQGGEYKSDLRRLVNTLEDYNPQPEAVLPDELYDVMMIAAPIFDANGDAVFNLSLGSFEQKLSGATINAYAERLVRACVGVMRADRAQRGWIEPTAAESAPTDTRGARDRRVKRRATG